MAKRVILTETAFFGQGSITEIPVQIRKRGFKKAFVVSDQVLVSLGATKRVLDLLDAEQMPYEIFSAIKPNPTIQNVLDGVVACRAAGADYILAIGGGSSLDTAKGIGIVMTNPEREKNLRSLEYGLPTAETANPSMPIIAVPTAAGTASEVTINYVITDVENKRKFVCVDPHDLPVCAVIDSDMMASMPPSLVAATGMDALTHAIEGYITGAAWELTDMFTIKAVEIIARALRDAVKTRSTAAISDMGLAQYIAGMGFSNVGLGVVHGMAHPLGAFYDIPHGVANALLLPVVMEFNAPACGEKYRNIARAMGVKNTEQMDEAQYRAAAVGAVRALSLDIGIPQKLSELGVKREDIPALAISAFKDPNTGGNPRPVSVEQLEELFTIAY